MKIDLSTKNSFKCTHARMSVVSWTQGKWTRNFRGNCLSQLVILLLVWLVSRLSELFFTPYSLEILVIVNPYQNVTVLSAKRDHLSHERTRGHTTKTQRKWEKLCHKQPRLENFNQNFLRENWTLKNLEFFGWIVIISFDRGEGGEGEGQRLVLGNKNWRE